MQHLFTAPRNLRMVATDLDGTIIPHGGTVSARTSAALQACRDAGVHVVYVTGRPPRWLAPVVEATGHTGYAICANGSITLDSAAASLAASATASSISSLASSAVVRLHPIPNEVVLEVAKRLRAAVPDVVFAVETPDGIRVEDRYETRRGSGRVEGLAPSAQQAGSHRAEPTLEQLLDHEPLIKLVAYSSASTPDSFLAAARRHVTDLVAPTHSSPAVAILEMGPLGVTKATSLAELAQSWGIAPAEIVTFGDMPNDVDMLRWAGTSYAMTGGHPDAIAAADHVAPSAADDGVAQVLEDLLLRSRTA